MSVDRILAQVLGGGAASGFAGGLAGGLASGLLTSKKGRKMAKQALKLGGIAAVGGLAYAAWNRYRDSRGIAGGTALPAAPAALLEQAVAAGFLPPPTRRGASDELGLVLLRAMIAAARADGKLDGDERGRIFDRVAGLDLDDAEKAELWSQLEHPVDMETLVSAATTPERALEIYSASRLAIDADTAAERGYLAMLAGRLGLADELVAAVDREIDAREAALTLPSPTAAPQPVA